MNKKYYDKNNYIYKNTIPNAKLLLVFFITLFLLLALILKIFYLQFIDGNHLKELAMKQQITDEIISPTRGTIYDSTGNVLAISSYVDTITINPSMIVVKDDEQATI